jgi:uncharacterized membrane protein YesL
MANTHVKNNEYIKIHELFNKLNNYINPNSEYDAETTLLKEFLDPVSDENFETTNTNLFENDAQTGSKYDVDKTFVNLIKQAILCKIFNIKYEKYDITEDTKGLFKFVKPRGDEESKTGTVLFDYEKVGNILASLDVINTIIDVYDAYANFIKNNPEIYAIEDFNNIIIVKDTDIKANIKESDDKNSGYFIKLDAEQAVITISTGVKRINRPTLFLAIKSFSSSFLDDYKKYHDLTHTDPTDTTKYGKNSGTSPDTSTGTALFNAAGSLNSGSGGSAIDIHGIYLKKAGGGDYELVDDDSASPTYTALKNSNYKSAGTGTYKARNQVIFREFINYMCKLQNKDKYNGVYAVLNLLRMCKVYINLAITNCNIMFNRVFVTHSAAPVLDYAQTTTFANGGTAGGGVDGSWTHEGFVLKYLTNDKIRTFCNTAGNEIYDATAYDSANTDTEKYFKDAQYTVISGAITASATEYTTTQTEKVGKEQMLNNSYYGLALKENKTFYDEIIIILSKLKYELSESISILNESIDISTKGFEAKVIDHNTIRIKRRHELVKNICKDGKDGGTKCTSANIGSLDHTSGTSPPASDESFNLTTILSDLANHPDIQDAFINNNINIISRFYHIKIAEKDYEIVKINKTPNGYIEYDIKARLSYTNFDSYDELYSDEIKAPILKLTDANVKRFIVQADDTYSDVAQFTDFNAAKSGYILFHNIAANKVTLERKDAYDYNNTYINNIKAIKKSNSNINTNESKIKNYETIYNTYKSRYDFMHNQFMAYSTIIAILAVALLVGSVSSNNLATTKLITLICFGIIILIFVTYYVFNILYMNEHFTNKKKVEKFEVGAYELVNTAPFPKIKDNNHLEFKTTDHSENFMYKKANFVQNQIDAMHGRITQIFELLNVGIRQNDSNYAFGNLMNISTNEKISRKKINTILDNKKVNTTTHIDLLKYEIAVYRIRINTLLYSALLIIGLITINLYTEGEYYGNLVFIGTLFGIVILSYYLIYSNHIVRTESKNFYWGREFEANFE